MMPGPTGGRQAARAVRLAVAAAAGLAILAGASACDRTDDLATPTDPAGPVPTNAAPTASPPASPPPTDQLGPGGGGGQAAGSDDLTAESPAEEPVTFPDTAEAYADAVVTAWQAGDLDRLGDLTAALVFEQLLEIPAQASLGWTDPLCDGTAGSSYCAQYSQPAAENLGSGEALTLRIRHDLLGQAGAAVEVTHAELAFETEWEAYLLDFLSAWHGGDYDRLRQLAVPEVVSYAVTTAAPIHPILEAVGGGGGLVQVAVTNRGGFQLQLDVGTTKLGGPQAIVGHQP